MSDIEELIKLDKRFRESWIKKSVNFLSVGFLKLISHLPFWFLYLKADFLYLLIRYVIQYRKNVIYTNLKKSFPEKPEKEIKEIAGKFYHHFCDMAVETIKAYSMSAKQYEKRVNFLEPEIFDNYFEEGKSPIILGMHYNNWEWNSYGQIKIKPVINVVYNPIRGNRAFENFMNIVRGKWGNRLIPVHKSARITVNFHKQKEPVTLYLVADQTPPPTTKYWINFLNQETPFFSGPEKIAKRSGQPILFQHVRKIKRGHYEVIHYKLIEDPTKVDDKEILIAYARKMEEIISEEPEYYLWSHRRWKHKRPEKIGMID